MIPYKYLTVPTNLKDRWITDAEIRLLEPLAVHHVIVFIQDPKNLARVDGNLLAGVAPGDSRPDTDPASAKDSCRREADLSDALHAERRGDQGRDDHRIEIRQRAPETSGSPRPVLNMTLPIPAGEANHEVKSSFVFKEDAHLTSLIPTCICAARI